MGDNVDTRRTTQDPPPLSEQERDALLHQVRTSTPTQRLKAFQELMQFVRGALGAAGKGKSR